jgi:hypothetical protein
MLHMQHAHVVSLLVRQQEAARRKGQRDAIAEARRAAAPAGAAEPEAQPGAGRRARKLHLPRPA